MSPRAIIPFTASQSGMPAFRSSRQISIVRSGSHTCEVASGRPGSASGAVNRSSTRSYSGPAGFGAVQLSIMSRTCSRNAASAADRAEAPPRFA